MSKTVKLRVKLVSLVKRFFNVYFARFFLESKVSAFQKIKTKKNYRNFFIFRNVIKYQMNTRIV